MMLRSLEILRRRKLIAVVVFATVLASAATFAMYLPNLYRATAVVLVERPVSEQFVRAAVSGELESRLHIIKQEILSRARLTRGRPRTPRGGSTAGAAAARPAAPSGGSARRAPAARRRTPSR